MTYSNHPHHGSTSQPSIYGLLAVCAFLFGIALLWLDRRGGGYGGPLLVVGLVGLAAALAAAVAAAVEHRRSPRRR